MDQERLVANWTDYLSVYYFYSSRSSFQRYRIHKRGTEDSMEFSIWVVILLTTEKGITLAFIVLILTVNNLNGFWKGFLFTLPIFTLASCLRRDFQLKNYFHYEKSVFCEVMSLFYTSLFARYANYGTPPPPYVFWYTLYNLYIWESHLNIFYEELVDGVVRVRSYLYREVIRGYTL